MRRTVIRITVCAVFAGGLFFLMNSRFKSHRAFKWFDKLGFPDVKGCKLVRVEQGEGFYHVPGFAASPCREGFLVNDDKKQFTVLTLDLFLLTLDKPNENIPIYRQFRCEELDLQEFAQRYPSADTVDKGGDSFSSRYPLLETRAQAFVLAWACYRNGYKKLATELCREVLTSQTFRTIPFGSTPMGGSWDHAEREKAKGDLAGLLQKDIGHALTWRAVVAFDDLSVSRPELLKKFETIVKHCPKSRTRRFAKGIVKILQQMIREDAAHSKKPHVPIEQMSSEDRIADLIFHLRDQNGKQYGHPGVLYVLDDPRADQSPADQLFEMGYDAVPQLIEALEDYRLTRSVSCHRPYYFSHHVYRVNDCALEIIELIARRSFYGRSYIEHMSKDGGVRNDSRDWGSDAKVSSEQKIAVICKEIESWWRQLQTKGEKQLLIDAARTGGHLVTGQAALLVKKYPDAAAEPLMEGARHCEEDYTRSNFIRLLGKLDGRRVETFLYEQIEEKTFPRTRVEAARILYDRGKLDVIATILKAWEQLLIDRERRPLSPGGSGPRDVVTLEDMEYGAKYSYIDDGLRHISQFLVDSEVKEAIEVLGRDMQQLSIYQRTEIIDHIGNKLGEIIKRLDEEELLHQEDLGHTALPVMEKLLVSLLHDTEVQEGLSSYRYGKDYKNPRVCDTAALMLWHHFVDKYEFDIESPESIRDKQIQKCIKTWEASNSPAD
ncbi:MAG: hypothetical protein V3V47_08370 [Desulfobacteria bacterium]